MKLQLNFYTLALRYLHQKSAIFLLIVWLGYRLVSSWILSIAFILLKDFAIIILGQDANWFWTCKRVHYTQTKQQFITNVGIDVNAVLLVKKFRQNLRYLFMDERGGRSKAVQRFPESSLDWYQEPSLCICTFPWRGFIVPTQAAARQLKVSACTPLCLAQPGTLPCTLLASE